MHSLQHRLVNSVFGGQRKSVRDRDKKSLGSLAGSRGTAALEFAIASTCFFTLLLATMEVAYDFFVQTALDNAIQTVARSVQVGTTQRGSSQTLSNFMQQSVCTQLGNLLNCSQLYISITSVPSGVGANYYTYLLVNSPNLAQITSTRNLICTGTAGQLMILNAFYLGPTLVGMLIPGFSQPSPLNDTQRVHVSFASTGFINEDFSGGEAGC